MKLLNLITASLFLTAPLLGDTPLDQKIDEEKITLIECSTTDKGTPPINLKQGTYHYRLFLPKGHNENPSWRFPLLFVASPMGNANMKSYAKRMKKDGWIVVMLVESKNAVPGEVQLGNFAAAYDDVMKRARPIRDFICATGISGGARVSGCMPFCRDGLKGILFQAAGFPGGSRTDTQNAIFSKYPKDLMIYVTLGNTDFNLVNYFESETVRKVLPAQFDRRLVIFKGGHVGCPDELFNDAFDLFERRAILGDQIKKDALEAREWYGRKLKAQLASFAEGDDLYTKYNILNDLQTIGKLAKWSRDKSKKEQLKAWRVELGALKKDKQVKKNLRADKAYKKVIAGLEKSLASLVGGEVGYKVSKMLPQEIKNIESLIFSLKKFADKHEGTHAARDAIKRIKSFEMEIAKPKEILGLK